MACAVAPPSPLPARKRWHGSAGARTGLSSFPTAALRYRHLLRWQNQGGSHLRDRSRCVPRRGNYRDPSRSSGRTWEEKQPQVARLRPTGNQAYGRDAPHVAQEAAVARDAAHGQDDHHSREPGQLFGAALENCPASLDRPNLV